MAEHRAPRRKRPPPPERRTRKPPPPRPDIARKPQPRGEVLPFRPNVPKKMERGNENLIIYYNELRNFLSLEMVLTFILIGFTALFATAIHANNTNVQAEINRRTQYMRSQQVQIVNLTDQLTERYTSYEIERRALELGLSFPDPSQIQSITVPRQGTVMLNTTDYLLPPENHFWQDITAFIRNNINRIFGGN